jgi:hypothetical protein
MRGGVSPRRGGNLRDLEQSAGQMATTPPQATPTSVAPPPAAPKKGLPSVVPDFVIPTKESPTQPASAAPKFPEAPNFMQKFTEITGGAAAEGENLISKGKELIFKKFGLGN